MIAKKNDRPQRKRRILADLSAGLSGAIIGLIAVMIAKNIGLL